MTGWANGETAGTADAYVAPTCTSTYTATTAIADSPLAITCSGASAGDYDFIYAAGALTVVSPTATPTPVPTAAPIGSPTATPTEQVGGVTAPPATPTLPSTSSSSHQGSDGGSTPLIALLICLAFGGLGLLVVQAQRRSIRS